MLGRLQEKSLLYTSSTAYHYPCPIHLMRWWISSGSSCLTRSHLPFRILIQGRHRQLQCLVCILTRKGRKQDTCTRTMISGDTIDNRLPPELLKEDVESEGAAGWSRLNYYRLGMWGLFAKTLSKSKWKEIKIWRNSMYIPSWHTCQLLSVPQFGAQHQRYGTDILTTLKNLYLYV